MSTTHRGRVARAAAAALIIALTGMPILAGRAAGESAAELRERMAAIRASLDARTAALEVLRGQKEELTSRIAEVQNEMRALDKKNAKLLDKVIARAIEVYKSGGTSEMEALLGAESFAELSDRAQILGKVAVTDNQVFIQLDRSKAEHERLAAELADRQGELADTEDYLLARTDELQDDFAAAQELWDEFNASPAVGTAVASTGAPVIYGSTNGMACPVAGPVSFTDTWGAPRDGHTHQGVDMMAAYGTPIVAIVSGTITYSGYQSSAGNWLMLSGDNGNGYWYMHNQQNIVTGGHVSVGQQIATVGDTGNAVGTPHLHFEYHPGGGAAVNPTPLVAAIC